MMTLHNFSNIIFEKMFTFSVKERELYWYLLCVYVVLFLSNNTNQIDDKTATNVVYVWIPHSIMPLIITQRTKSIQGIKNCIPFCIFEPIKTPRSSHDKSHDNVIKWKHFPRYWPFVRGIHRSKVNSPHKGQWRGALMFFFDLRLNKRLSKQWWGWWFDTLSRPLWRHHNDLSIPKLQRHN